MGAGASVSPRSRSGRILLTSNGLSTPEITLYFMKQVLANKGIKMPEVEGTPTWEQVEAIKKTYAEAIATVKVVVMNDTQWFFDGPENEEFTQQKPEMIWDHKMFHDFGVPMANSTNVELFGKPWLYGDEIRDPDCHKWGTRHRCAYAADVDKDDGDKWDALIAEADDVYAKLQAKELSAATSSPSLAERWSALSRELDEKYAAKLEAWFQKVMGGADVICGAGGDVVIVNLAYQLNRAVADKMAKLIHDGGPVYVGRSAGTMITAKSMEMTAEVAPGWLENFSDPHTSAALLTLAMADAIAERVRALREGDDASKAAARSRAARAPQVPPPQDPRRHRQGHRGRLSLRLGSRRRAPEVRTLELGPSTRGGAAGVAGRRAREGRVPPRRVDAAAAPVGVLGDVLARVRRRLVLVPVHVVDAGAVFGRVVEVAVGARAAGAALARAHVREALLDVPDAGVDLRGPPPRLRVLRRGAQPAAVEEPVEEALHARLEVGVGVVVRAPACVEFNHWFGWS